MRLEGKVVLITGAGSGIGRACTNLFASEDARVALIARRRERLEELVCQLGSDRALALPGDITDDRFIETAVAQTARAFGGLHILVNSAAELLPGTVESQSLGDWDTTFATNVRAAWLLSRAVIPHMRNTGNGSIIHLASVVGQIGASNRLAYGASKGALIAMTKCMAMDLGARQIRVNCVCPGIVDTELVENFILKAPDPEAARRARVGLHPLGRFGTADDIAAMCLYLASDESAWVTGAALTIDGGYTAGKL
ncbi:MAG: SDR family oxidoreductase [Terriglobales bacterium]|jgi:NAD(P)-dependent dehydrogenase (short-subunit alcohol dehydrogenase family)